MGTEKANGVSKTGIPSKIPVEAHPVSEESTEIASNINYHAQFSPHFSPLKFEPEQAFYATAESVRDRLVQVFALLLRPKKEHKYRFYWNIYHHTIGYTVIILSIINIFKGFDILDPEKKWKRTYIGILIALGAIAVVLEAFTWTVVLKRKKESPEKHANGTNPYSNGYGSRTQPVV